MGCHLYNIFFKWLLFVQLISLSLLKRVKEEREGGVAGFVFTD